MKKTGITSMFLALAVLLSFASFTFTAYASSGATRYEAENAALINCSASSFNGGALSGGKQVVDFHRRNNSSITFNNVNASGSGTYNILYRYSNGHNFTSKIKVYVNNVLVDTRLFPPSGSWSIGWNSLTTNVSLRAGNNTIRLHPDGSGPYGSGDGDAINLDYIDVIRSSPITSKGSVKAFIVAHEDDEVIAFGGSIQKALAEGFGVKIVLVTNGDISGVEAGRTRIKESVDAMRSLGLKQSDIIFLGYPDSYLATMFNNPGLTYKANNRTQTYGNDAIGSRDFRRSRTGVSAYYRGNDVTADIRTIINEFRPIEIYTHSVYDDHSDHSSVFRFVNKALTEIKTGSPNYKPRLCTTIECFPGVGYSWPGPAGQTQFNTPFPSPRNLETLTPLRWANRTTIRLSRDMIERKKTALDFYVSQEPSSYYQYIHNDEFFWVQ